MAKTAPAKSSSAMEQHPLALKLVPGSMPDEEFEAFCADIGKRGQQVPITLYENKILDGWHRHRACLKLGITPKTIEYTGDDAAGFVIALNVLRRKLGSTQRALAGARLNIDYSITQDEASKRVGISKVHINLVVQALRSNNARILKLLENPDLTRAALHEELVDCGVVRASPGVVNAAQPAGKTTLNPDAMRSGLEGFFAAVGASDPDDDLLGSGVEASPELDDVLGTPPSAGGKVLDFKGKGKEPAETTPGGMPLVGSKPSHPERRTKDTPAYRLAEAFKGLSEPEKFTFMQMVWPVMRPLIKPAGLSTELAVKADVEQASAAAATAIAKASKAAKTPAKGTRQKKVA